MVRACGSKRCKMRLLPCTQTSAIFSAESYSSHTNQGASLWQIVSMQEIEPSSIVVLTSMQKTARVGYFGGAFCMLFLAQIMTQVSNTRNVNLQKTSKNL